MTVKIENLWSAFNQEVENGRNEEVGSTTPLFEVDGENYYVMKTGEDEFALFAEGECLPTLHILVSPDKGPDPSDEKTWDWSAVYFISLWLMAHDPYFADNDYMDNWDNAKKAYVGFLTDYQPDEYFEGGLPEKLTDYLNETR